VLAFAFCASAAADPQSKNVVLRPQQAQQVVKTSKKMCYTVSGGSRIPQPCNRIAAIPTTNGAMDIIGHRNGQ